MSALGTYSSIIDVTVPGSAKPGDVVQISVTVQNLYNFAINFKVLFACASISVLNLGDFNIPAYSWQQYTGQFIMPDNPLIDCLVETLYYDSNGNYNLDAFQNVSIPFTPPVENTWQKVANPTSITIGEGVDFSSFTPIRRLVFAGADKYEGKYEECNFYFQAPSFINWLGFAQDAIINAFTSELSKQGLAPMSVDIYGGQGALINDYILKVNAHPITSASYAGAAAFVFPVVPAVWAAIIIGVLAVLLIVAVTFLVISVKELVKELGAGGTFAASIAAIAIIGIVGGAILLPAITRYKQGVTA